MYDILKWISMERRLGMLLAIAVLSVLTVGTVAGYSPALEITHEYSDHGGTLADVEYDAQYDITWSLDENGTFVAYEVGNEEVGLAYDQFEVGHALAVGDGSVYIAEADTLWEFDVKAGEMSELGTLNEHPGAMAYDAERDVIWAGGQETVYGYNTDDGSEYASYSPHSDGIETIDVRGDYIATGTTWKSEFVVYDIEQEDIVLEPELDAVGGVTATHLTENGDVVVGTRGDDADDLIAMYDIESGDQLVSYRKHIFSVSEVKYEPDTETIISTGFDNTVKFYDVNEQAVIEKYQHEDTIYTADLDQTNDLLWIGDGEERTGTVTGLDIEDQEPDTTEGGADTDAETASGDESSGDKGESAGDEKGAADNGDSSDADGPGFGVIVGLIALVTVALIGRRLHT